MRIKKAALIGLGAIGSFFAPGLHYVLGGDFRVIAQGERKERLERDRVTINGVNYKFPIIQPDTNDGPSDLVIIAVKDYALESAIRQIKHQVGEDTVILAVLNGIDSEEKVSAVYGWEHVLYSSMNIPIAMKDGVATFNPGIGGIRFGEAKNDTLSERVIAVKELFERAGIRHRIEQDMLRCLWLKFMSNVGENQTCALLGIPHGSYYISDYPKELRIRAMREVIAIAQAKGIDLTEKDMWERVESSSKIPPQTKPSTLQDLESGRQTEVEMFAGKVISLGREYGIPTPTNEFFYYGIKTLEEKNAGKFDFK
ncbi:MAG: ketopantoate reductase family protein [Eubacteriales bacterium]